MAMLILKLAQFKLQKWEEHAKFGSSEDLENYLKQQQKVQRNCGIARLSVHERRVTVRIAFSNVAVLKKNSPTAY